MNVETWKASELTGKVNPASFALGGLNPPPRKGDTARLARWARRVRIEKREDVALWDAIAAECSAYAEKFEQGTLLLSETGGLE